MIMLFQTIDELVADVRLAKLLTVAERYLPLSEFAARLQKAIGARVKADAPMATRKLTLFVNGKPIAETMRMVAEAMDAHWVAIGPDWHLRSKREAIVAERASKAADEAARRDALLAYANYHVQHVQSEHKDSLYGPMARLIAWLGAKPFVERMLAGNPVAASADGRWGSLRFPCWITDQKGGRIDGLLVMWPFPDSSYFNTIFINGNTDRGTSTVLGPDTVLAPKDAVARRAKAWAADGDPAVMRTPLKSVPLGKPPSPSGEMGLADALAQIHAQSGLPLASEAFRGAINTFRAVPGPMVADALKFLTVHDAEDETGVGWSSQSWRFASRGQSGWLLLRPAQAWRFRPGEAPESALTPLEGKVPSLDDYARLAGSLDERQTREIERIGQVADFPIPKRFDRVCRGLAIYDALSVPMRRQARFGLEFDGMPPLAQSRWHRAVLLNEFDHSGETAFIEAAFKGFPHEDAAFQIEFGWEEDDDWIPAPPEGGENDPRGPYTDVVFKFMSGTYTPSCSMPLYRESSEKNEAGEGVRLKRELVFLPRGVYDRKRIGPKTYRQVHSILRG